MADITETTEDILRRIQQRRAKAFHRRNTPHSKIGFMLGNGLRNLIMGEPEEVTRQRQIEQILSESGESEPSVETAFGAAAEKLRDAGFLNEAAQALQMSRGLEPEKKPSRVFNTAGGLFVEDEQSPEGFRFVGNPVAREDKTAKRNQSRKPTMSSEDKKSAFAVISASPLFNRIPDIGKKDTEGGRSAAQMASLIANRAALMRDQSVKAGEPVDIATATNEIMQTIEANSSLFTKKQEKNKFNPLKGDFNPFEIEEFDVLDPEALEKTIKQFNFVPKGN